MKNELKLDHYESQSEDEAVAEDEASFEAPGQTVMEIPSELVLAVRELIAKHKAALRLTKPLQADLRPLSGNVGLDRH